MTSTLKEKLKRYMFLPPLALGILAVAIAVNTREGPEQTPPSEATTRVRIVEAVETKVIPRALGYGHVEPHKTWEAVAQVAGEIVEIHPRLKKGALLAEGELLLRVDPADYELAVAEIEANLQSVSAQLAEIDSRVENTEASLEIEERSLALSRVDLERKRQLLARGNASQATVDQQERDVLGRQLTVQSLKNTLNLIPAERDVLLAQRALHEAQLESAKLDLERTRVIAPFDLRVSEVTVERAQYVSKGEMLVVGDGIAVAEVTAQLPVDKMATLVPPGMTVPTDIAGAMQSLPALIPLEAVVRLRTGTLQAEWPARFARISDTVDPQTRTVGVIVAVDAPFQMTIPGKRPPLTKNMYVEVELRGPSRDDLIVIPRSALHDGRVYLVDADNRLEMREVDVAFSQTNFAVVESGLSSGERLVVSDLVPAINGMLLDPVEDAGAADSLRAEAEGLGDVR